MEQFDYKSKLYKIRLVKTECDIFGNPIPSDKWGVLVNAMNEDLHKEKEFKFQHPKTKKPYYRHYKDSPANGVARLVVGQFRDQLDFAYVRIILDSFLYKEPYLVISRYDFVVRNPDYLAEMVSKAFNWALKGLGLMVTLEPWDSKGETITWCLDYELSYENQLRKIKGANLIQAGYEDSLEENKKKEAKKRKRKEARAKTEDNKFDIINFMSSKVKNKPKLLDWLDEKVKGQNGPKGMMRPVRFLMNKKLMKGLTISAFNKRYHKEGLISVSSFNNYTNNQYKCFVNDPIYDDMEENFEIDRFI